MRTDEPRQVPDSVELGLVADTVPFSCVDGPGNRYVVFLQGCNFDCTACHKPHTIPMDTARARVLTVEDVLDDLRPHHRFLSGVTVSGGEATQQPYFLRDLFTAVKADPELAHLTTFVRTNGSAGRGVWDMLLPVTDGVMVDLKAFDSDVHLTLTGTANAAVLRSICHLAARDRLYEVRLPLVPGLNDTADQLRRTAGWLLSVDPDVRLKIIGFRARGVRASARGWPEPTEEQRREWARVLQLAGVREIELG